MDQSYSDSDISLSPSKILERLQVLRQLQLMQRGKLHKQRLEYQENTENSSSITEIVSQFSNSTTYNTFRSLLETTDDATPRSKIESVSPKVRETDLIEGVSILNLSQESEFIVKSPSSARSLASVTSQNEPQSTTNVSDAKSFTKKQISLDEMPVLTPKKDFEALILEKLKGEINKKVIDDKKQKLCAVKAKKKFLKKGEGTSRFGIQKNDLVIQNTKSLPWRKNAIKSFTKRDNLQENVTENHTNNEAIITNAQIVSQQPKAIDICKSKEVSKDNIIMPSEEQNFQHPIKELTQHIPKDKHPPLRIKGKTWASVLSKEQNDFLHQLKQSDYYKNFASPAKSTMSDASCDENLLRLKVEREAAEQNMFELLESKVSHESFNLENSFFNRFLRHSQLECSGENTPLVMQQCLAKNPNLIKILPKLQQEIRNSYSFTNVETNDECSECCSETCSTVSSCCSCKTVEESNTTLQDINVDKNNKLHQKIERHNEKQGFTKKSAVNKAVKILETEKNKSDNVNNSDSEIKANMVEMNEKLIATSELLKERLCELENEIETFRQENANLAKVRDEFDAERHKFYEEKAMFEQKFNEDKILSEYYLAEEKEKLSKQKQMYEKYVREMRGRLNKKDKDEVISLKKEISDLKEEIRLKDAKSTSTIARLRNQIKVLEKEKKDLLDETEKLKKENRRIQHSNDMTRRMTNIKYLEEINKKLSNITAKETQSEINFDNNAKYKTLEIERQGRCKKVQVPGNRPLRSRAKSVPNLKVTSRYAKYFSQRDVVSDLDRNKFMENSGPYTCSSDNYQSEDEVLHIENESQHGSDSDHEENNLEKLYMERFHSLSPKSSRSNLSISNSNSNKNNERKSNSPHNHNEFFISKSTSSNDCRLSNNITPTNQSTMFNSHKSKTSISITSPQYCNQKSRNSTQELHINKLNTIDQISDTSNDSGKSRTSKSPVSIITNRSASSHKPTTVIHKDYFRDTFNVSPEPTSSRTSVSKTNLNPTEIKKPDGSKELRFPNGNIKFVSSDGKYSKFIYYNGDVKENFYNEGRIKYFYAESKTYHTTHADGLEVLEFPDGQVEKRYKDGSSEIHLPNGSIRYFDPKNEHVREEWRFPDGTAITVSASGEQRIVFSNGQVEVHATDHKRREFPDGTVKLVYNDGTSETRYVSGRVRIKDKHGNLIMDSVSR
ncbi:unnamed protein product [Chilo suppressalis]|uniref:Centromere protein J C-terminal domain-containing protein n=1 Tax=Chilo suppressalis TaxID=168631 RepID=A0ABN8EAL7_CHISP|nr:unnamed protein product [Chilo suppressalis]